LSKRAPDEAAAVSLSITTRFPKTFKEVSQ
jgi:hypothetical protein